MSNQKKRPTLYRGKRETMPQTGKVAEPRFTTDTHELFVNDGDGKNILVGSPNSIKFKFNYDANIQYDKLDLVNYEGTLYLSIIEENRGNNPRTPLSTAWIMFVDLNLTELDNLRSMIDTAIAEYNLELSEEYLKKIPVFSVSDTEPEEKKDIHFWFDTNPIHPLPYVNEDLGGGSYDDSPSGLESIGGDSYDDSPPGLEDLSGDSYDDSPPGLEDLSGDSYDDSPPGLEDVGGSVYNG